MNNSEYIILIVDDEEDILEFVGYNLKKEGYQVYTAINGRNAIQVAKEKIPHLIIIDVMMPGLDGIETCRELREIPYLQDSVIAFLTARNEDYSQIAGFEAGADDYISKPIKPRLLTSKISSLLRRYGKKSTDNSAYTVGNLSVNKEQFRVTIDDRELTLPKKEFELLALLTSKPNKVFTREEIYSSVWDDNIIVGERTIDVHIRKIREKLQNDNIKTIKGVGYKYEL
ncbi:MAG: response regulator transcription factor [Bacteroidia bacterium]|nr:response regulator transcription factor [Bacteroidia bacterium]